MFHVLVTEQWSKGVEHCREVFRPWFQLLHPCRCKRLQLVCLHNALYMLPYTQTEHQRRLETSSIHQHMHGCLQILTYIHANHIPRRVLTDAEPLMSLWAILNWLENCSSQASAPRRFSSICKVLEPEKEKACCIHCGWTAGWSPGPVDLVWSQEVISKPFFLRQNYLYLLWKQNHEMSTARSLLGTDWEAWNQLQPYR